MKLGEKVKYFRKMRKLSQKDLAEGICSISYLSKIENCTTEPSEEIGIFLGKRLDIDLYNTSYSKRKEEYKSLFYHLYNRDKFESEIAYRELLNARIDHTEDSILLNIFKSMYLLLMSQNTNEATRLINEVSYLNDGAKSEKSFYYFIVKGLRDYYLNDFKEALNSFKKAEEVIEIFQYHSWEKGYLYYLISLTANRLWKNSMCLDYAKLALNIFEKRYDFKRCADSRILLGIVYQRFENWVESHKHFKMAESVANAFNDNFLKGAIYQNLGYNESKKGNSEGALSLYNISLELKKDQPVETKTSTLFTLIREYLKFGEFSKCRKRVLDGLSLVRENPNLYEYQLHFNHYFNILEYGACSEVTTTYLVENVIPYLEGKNESTYQVEYLQLVGEYFEHEKKYKLSSQYYLKALNIYKKYNQG
ncbi:helix-turn-helix transcriptional regulator [Fictibacillus nanhaiensis]|uniref:Helix-turn-helix transcriptional regulator n=1 Tax=Fictibacillus nanhaiensis TaxID=742169 RepID=A0ABS2ZMB8_9BACL|nr:helix-turn-helix transcriptional regulator [Fictibacillus nanhaiensis]